MMLQVQDIEVSVTYQSINIKNVVQINNKAHIPMSFNSNGSSLPCKSKTESKVVGSKPT